MNTCQGHGGEGGGSRDRKKLMVAFFVLILIQPGRKGDDKGPFIAALGSTVFSLQFRSEEHWTPGLISTANVSGCI